MKFSLDWHKNNLVNLRKSMERRKEIYQQALSDFVRVENEVRHLEMQILTAEQQGKDGFDPERFLEKFRVRPSPTVNPQPAPRKE